MHMYPHILPQKNNLRFSIAGFPQHRRYSTPRLRSRSSHPRPATISGVEGGASGRATTFKGPPVEMNHQQLKNRGLAMV